ncbi:MAG: 6-phosphofructokinase [Candidatus Omnitrophica bacterium]|nr:6-phosphofructokinase [Candidatus Omnitrophota bacterium]
MIKFKKAYQFKIISIVLSVVFLFHSTAYGIDISDMTSLRTRLLCNPRVSSEGPKRLSEGMAAMLNRKGLSRYHHRLLNQALGTFFVDDGIREDIYVLDTDEIAAIDPSSDLRGIEHLNVYRFSRRQLIVALQAVGAAAADIDYITANLISHPGRFRDDRGNPQATNLFILDDSYEALTRLLPKLQAQWARHERAHLYRINLPEVIIQILFPLKNVVRALREDMQEEVYSVADISVRETIYAGLHLSEKESRAIASEYPHLERRFMLPVEGAVVPGSINPVLIGLTAAALEGIANRFVVGPSMSHETAAGKSDRVYPCWQVYSHARKPYFILPGDGIVIRFSNGEEKRIRYIGYLGGGLVFSRQERQRRFHREDEGSMLIEETFGIDWIDGQEANFGLADGMGTNERFALLKAMHDRGETGIPLFLLMTRLDTLHDRWGNEVKVSDAEREGKIIPRQKPVVAIMGYEGLETIQDLDLMPTHFLRGVIERNKTQAQEKEGRDEPFSDQELLLWFSEKHGTRLARLINHGIYRGNLSPQNTTFFEITDFDVGTVGRIEDYKNANIWDHVLLEHFFQGYVTLTITVRLFSEKLGLRVDSEVEHALKIAYFKSILEGLGDEERIALIETISRNIDIQEDQAAPYFEACNSNYKMLKGFLNEFGFSYNPASNLLARSFFSIANTGLTHTRFAAVELPRELAHAIMALRPEDLDRAPAWVKATYLRTRGMVELLEGDTKVADILEIVREKKSTGTNFILSGCLIDPEDAWIQVLMRKDRERLSDKEVLLRAIIANRAYQEEDGKIVATPEMINLICGARPNDLPVAYIEKAIWETDEGPQELREAVLEELEFGQIDIEGDIVVLPDRRRVAKEDCCLVFCGGGDCAGLNTAIAELAVQLAAKDKYLIGVRKGFYGACEENIGQELVYISPEVAGEIRYWPSTVLMSSRKNPFKVGEEEARRRLGANLEGFGGVFITGGDDHGKMASEVYHELAIPARWIPKSIDNDADTLMIGFQSAVDIGQRVVIEAAYNAYSRREAEGTGVFVLESMGRSAGHLAHAIGRKDLRPEDLPEDLREHYEEIKETLMVLVPEEPVTIQQTIERAREIYEQHGFVTIVVAEGFSLSQEDPDLGILLEDPVLFARFCKMLKDDPRAEGLLGDPVRLSAHLDKVVGKDPHGHPKLGGVAHYIEAILGRPDLGNLEVRRAELGFIMRGVPVTNPDERKLAEIYAQKAVELWERDIGGVGVTLKDGEEIAIDNVVARDIKEVLGTPQRPKNKVLTDLHTRKELAAAGVVMRPASGKEAPLFKRIGQGPFYTVFGNRVLGIVVKIQLNLELAWEGEAPLGSRFLKQDPYDKGIALAQKRLGDMAARTVGLRDVNVITDPPTLQPHRICLVQLDYFEEEDFLVNKLQRLVVKNTEASRREAKQLIDAYIEFIKEMWRRGVFIGDPELDNFAVKDGKLILIDFNFLEDDTKAEDFNNFVVERFCRGIIWAYRSLIHEKTSPRPSISLDDPVLLPLDEPHRMEVADYFLSRVKEIVAVRKGKPRFVFNKRKFERFWQKGSPIPMFASDEDREAAELILRDIVEGRTPFSTAGEILDRMRSIQEGLIVAN